MSNVYNEFDSVGPVGLQYDPLVGDRKLGRGADQHENGRCWLVGDGPGGWKDKMDDFDAYLLYNMPSLL
jgi:hypothetical protein